MVKSFGISNAIAIKMCNDTADEIDIGGAGVLKTYDGTRPADLSVAVTTQNIISEHDFQATAYGAAFDDTPGAKATANVIDPGTGLVNPSASAAWFRIFNGGGTAVHDGNIGTVDADLILDSTLIALGQTVTIDSGEILVPEVSP